MFLAMFEENQFSSEKVTWKKYLYSTFWFFIFMHCYPGLQVFSSLKSGIARESLLLILNEIHNPNNPK